MSQVLRVTTYDLQDAEFTGSVHRLHLRYALSADYFVMIRWGESTVGSIGPDASACRVTADPYGTGDLSTSGGNWLELTREDIGEALVGSVTVVECLRASGSAGFKLLSVEVTTLADHTGSGTQDDTDTSATAWRSADRIVPYCGWAGGGASSVAASSSADHQSFGVRVRPSGTATLNFQRHSGPGTTNCEEATFTTYVVEWGTEWDVQRVNVTGTSGGAGAATASDYDSTALTRAVNASTAWVWASGWTDSTTAATAWFAQLVTLGDGTSPVSGSVSSVSVGDETGGATRDFDCYVLSHPLISAEWSFHASGDGAVSSYDWTSTGTAPGSERYGTQDALFSRSTSGQRFGALWTSDTSVGSGGGENYWSAPRPISATLWRSYRADDGTPAAWTGWACLVDVSGLDRAALPVFRVTTYELAMAAGTTTATLELLHDLADDYFIVMDQTGDAATSSPAVSYAYLTADPNGTGDLTTSGAANELDFLRASGTSVDWSATVTVVECLRDQGGGGFRLRDVVTLPYDNALSDSLQYVEVAFDGAEDTGRCVPFQAGLISASASGHQYAQGAEICQGSVLRGYRHETGVTFVPHTMIVEWGAEWGVQRFLFGETAGGAGLNATSEYATASLGVPVTASRAWVHASFAGPSTDQPDSLRAALTLGDGVTVDGTQVAMGAWDAVETLAAVHVLTHPQLAVDQVFQGSTSNTSDDLAVDAPSRGEQYGTTAAGEVFTAGQRLGRVFNGCSDSTTTALAPGVIKARHTGAEVLEASRANGTGSWAGWAQSVDFGGIASADGALVAYDSSGVEVPQYVLLRSPVWTGSGVVKDVTSEGGLIPGPAVPGDDNVGRLVALAGGRPSAGTTIDLLMVKPGKAGKAGYVWRPGMDASATAWRAAHNRTLVHQAWAMSTTSAWATHAACYSERLGRLFMMHASDTRQLTVWSRDVNGSYAARAGVAGANGWTSSAFVASNYITGHDTAYGALAMVEARDGSILAFVGSDPGESENIATNTEQVAADMYRTTDGTNWSLVTSQVFALQGAGYVGRGRFQAARSGDWIRFTNVDEVASGAVQAVAKLRTFASSDNGASWVRATPVLQNVYRFASDGKIGTCPWGMAGLNDSSGTFLLTYMADSHANSTATVAVGYRDEDWAEQSSLDWDLSSYANGVIKGLALVCDEARVWHFAWVGGNDEDEVVARYAPLENALDADAWVTVGKVTRFADALRYGWHALQATWAGNHIVLSGCPVENDDGAAVDHWWRLAPGLNMVQMGGFDTRPLQWTSERTSTYWTDPLGNPDDAVAVNIVVQQTEFQWHAAIGKPDATSGTPWAQTTAGATETTWAVRTVDLSAFGASGQNYYHLSDILPPVDWGKDQPTCFRVVVGEIAAQRVAPSSGEDIGIRLRSNDISAAYDFTLRLGTTEVIAYDNGTAIQRGATVSTTDFADDLCDVRIVIDKSKGPVTQAKAWVRWRKLSDAPFGAWKRMGPIRVDLVAASASQTLRVGVIGTGAGTASKVKVAEVEVSYKHAWAQNDDLTWPDQGLGIRTERGPVHIEDRTTLRWGGVGTMVGDTYKLAPGYTRGVRELAMDSPRLMWESTTAAAQSLDFDAGAAALWNLSGLAMFGTVDRTATLSFATTQAGLDAPAHTVELSADVQTDLTVVAVDGPAVKLQAAPGESLAQEGRWLGRYVRFDVAGAASGSTYAVVDDADVANGWIILDRDIAADGIEVGATAVLYDDRMLWQSSEFRRYRWFRVTLPDVSSVPNSRGTPTGTHRIGTILPGHWHAFTVPLAWTFRDNEQPNTTKGRTRSAVDWAYEEGPAQRVVEGRVVGDIEEERQLWRDVLRVAHSYDVRPIALVLDGRRVNRETLVLGRWSSGSQHDNAGWKRETDGTWRTVGDADVVVTEVV